MKVINLDVCLVPRDWMRASRERVWVEKWRRLRRNPGPPLRATGLMMLLEKQPLRQSVMVTLAEKPRRGFPNFPHRPEVTIVA